MICLAYGSKRFQKYFRSIRGLDVLKKIKSELINEESRLSDCPLTDYEKVKQFMDIVMSLLQRVRKYPHKDNRRGMHRKVKKRYQHGRGWWCRGVLKKQKHQRDDEKRWAKKDEDSISSQNDSDTEREREGGRGRGRGRRGRGRRGRTRGRV